jgi:hypothetical protein
MTHIQLEIQTLTGKFKDKFVTIRYQIGSDKNMYTFGKEPSDDVYC